MMNRLSMTLRHKTRLNLKSPLLKILKIIYPSPKVKHLKLSQLMIKVNLKYRKQNILSRASKLIHNSKQNTMEK